MIINNQIVILPALDPYNPVYSNKQSSKTFFHFSLSVQKNMKVKVCIEKMKILEYFNSDSNVRNKLYSQIFLRNYIEFASVEEIFC